MYTIYVDGNLLYSPEQTDDGYIVTAAKLTRQVNLGDTLEFSIPSTNPSAGSITMLGSRIVVFQDDHVIFVGRAITAKKSIRNIITYHCEGGLAYYNDNFPRIKKDDEIYFAYLYDPVTPSVSTRGIYPTGAFLPSSYVPKKHIAVDISPAWVFDLIRNQTDYRPVTGVEFGFDSVYEKSLLEIFNEDILPVYGGTIVIEYTDNVVDNAYSVRPIWYASGDEPLNSQTIEFGSNLIEIAQEVDYSDVRTMYSVLGEISGGTKPRKMSINNTRHADTYGNYNGGASSSYRTVYVPSIPNLNQYGWIMDHLDVASQEDVSAANLDDYDDYMYSEIQKYAASKANTQLKFTCKAVDLHIVDSTQDALQIGHRNRIISTPNGIDTTVLCTRSEIDLLDPTRSQYTFGASFYDLSGMINPVRVSRIGNTVGRLDSIVRDVDNS